MSIEQRLKEERLRLGFNQADFAALAGKTKKTMIDYEKGFTAPDVKFLTAIASAGVDLMFVLTGKVSSESLSADETALLTGYRAMDARGKAGVLAFVSGFGQDSGTFRQTFNAPVGEVNQVGEAAGKNVIIGGGRKRK